MLKKRVPITILLTGLLILTVLGACPTDAGGGGGVENPSDGKIGEIKGTITLTNIPSPAPKVYIYVSGSDSSYSWHSKESQITLNSVTGTNAALAWSVPVYDNDGFIPSEGHFRLLVEVPGDNGFEIQIPATPYIPGANADVGDLGSVSIANPNIPDNPVSLTANIWKDDAVTEGGDVNWYSISVTNGTLYYLWWNDGDNGDGGKTLNIDVHAYNSGGNQISLGGNDSAWDDPVSFTAGSSGAVYLRVRAFNGGNNTGTYAIAYNTSGAKPAGPCTITFNGNNGRGSVPPPMTAYSGGSITLPSGSGLTYDDYIFGGWFDYDTDTNYIAGSSYPVTRTTTLYANWVNDETYTVSFDLNGGSGTTPAPQTGKYGSTITLPSGSGLTHGDYAFGGWYDNYTGDTYGAGSSYVITAAATLYAKWISNALGGEGNPIPLTADAWTAGIITDSTPNGEDWYSFSVTAGNTYYVWWNDLYEGDRSKKLDVKVTGYNTNGSTVFTDVDAAWLSPQSIAANSAGTVKLKVDPYDSGNTGTYAIAYSAGGDRPAPPASYTGDYSGELKYNSQPIATSVTLTADSISGGNITIPNVSIGSDNVVSNGGTNIGTWAYVYSGSAKIGIVYDINYLIPLQSLILGKTSADITISYYQTIFQGFSSLSTSDMADNYQGALTRE